jgi:hypothetical protein
MIKRKAMGNLFGLTGGYIRASGKEVSKTEKGCSKIKRGYRKVDFGAKAKRFDGWNDNNLIKQTIKCKSHSYCRPHGASEYLVLF